MKSKLWRELQEVLKKNNIGFVYQPAITMLSLESCAKITAAGLRVHGMVDFINRGIYVLPVIQDKQNEIEEELTLAHEIGHMIDFDLVERDKKWLFGLHFIEYNKLMKERKPLPKELIRWIVDTEVRAWNCGAELLHSLDFNNWLEFDREQDKSLATYRRLL